MTFQEVLPWAISSVTIYTMIKAGDKDRKAWWVSVLAKQPLWFIWVILTKTWGLLPLHIILLIIHIRNLYKWK